MDYPCDPQFRAAINTVTPARLERLEDYLSGNMNRRQTELTTQGTRPSKPWRETNLSDQKQFLLETPYDSEYSLHICLLVVSTVVTNTMRIYLALPAIISDALQCPTTWRTSAERGRATWRVGWRAPAPPSSHSTQRQTRRTRLGPKSCPVLSAAAILAQLSAEELDELDVTSGAPLVPEGGNWATFVHARLCCEAPS